MTKNELINLIEDGSDISLKVSGRSFWIFTWTDDGICITEEGQDGIGARYYGTASELVNYFRINDVPIGDLVKGIKILEYS